MKVLFICSGTKNNKPSAIINAQLESLLNEGLFIKVFTINEKGFTGYFKSIFQLKKILNSNDFDILHAHYGFSAIVAFFTKKKQKLIVSFMGDDIVGSNKQDGSIKKSSLILARFNIIMSKLFYDYTIVKSQEMFSRFSHKKVALIPNGVDLNKFKIIDKSKSRVKLNIEKNKKAVIFVSDPKRAEKNYFLAQKAIKNLNDNTVELLTVFGVAHLMLPYYYNAANLLLMTSYHEGSPNVIKEAMACNCPIVSTNVGDVDWIINGTNGCFLTSFNETDVVEKIKLALKFSEEKDRTNGRQKIIDKKLDSKLIAKEIINIYKKIL